MPSSALTATSRLSLHDALPIWRSGWPRSWRDSRRRACARTGCRCSSRSGWTASRRSPTSFGMAGGRSRRSRPGSSASETAPAATDRKSTRLNSSHVSISYAVFCTHRDLPPFPTRRSSDLAQRLASELARFPQTCMREDRLSLLESLGLDGEQAIANELRHGRRSLEEVQAGLERFRDGAGRHRSEEHTSELQSRFDLVCRLLHSPRPPAFPYTTLFRSGAAAGLGAGEIPADVHARGPAVAARVARAGRRAGDRQRASAWPAVARGGPGRARALPRRRRPPQIGRAHV